MASTEQQVYRHILIESADRIATVTMNRPEKRNALSVEHMTELIGALREIGEDGEAAVVILRGNGPAFCAGHDLGESFAGDRRRQPRPQHLPGRCIDRHQRQVERAALVAGAADRDRSDLHGATSQASDVATSARSMRPSTTARLARNSLRTLPPPAGPESVSA